MPNISSVNTADSVDANSIDNTAYGSDLDRVVVGSVTDANGVVISVSGISATESEVEFDFGDPIANNFRYGSSTLELLSTPAPPANFTATLNAVLPAQPANFTASLTPPIQSIGAIFPTILDTGQITPAHIPTPHGGLVLDSSGGDRGEIGLFTEWQCEYLASGRNADLIIQHADEMLGYPWDDYDVMRNPFYLTSNDTNGIGLYSMGFTHPPNAFFMPYMLTGDPKYLAPMESQFRLHQGWTQFQNSQPVLDPNREMYHYTGRDLAWQLRNLGQLAYVEREFGDTVETYYQNVLELTRQKLLAQATLPWEAEFHCLSTNQFGSAMWQGWFEGYIAHTIAHIIHMGFEEWRGLAEWHAEHFLLRCGYYYPNQGYPFKAIDNDAVITSTPWPAAAGHTWENTHPYEGHDSAKKAYYDALGDDELGEVYYTPGIAFAWPDRVMVARNTFVQFINNGIRAPEFLELYNKTQDAIDYAYANDVRFSRPFYYKWTFEITATAPSIPASPNNFDATLTPPAPQPPLNMSASLTAHAFVNAPAGAWVAAPNTHLRDALPASSFVTPLPHYTNGPRAIMGAWNGASYDTSRDYLELFCEGGHADYAGNEYFRFNMATLAWEVIQESSDMSGWDSSTGKYSNYVDPGGVPAGDGQGIYNDGRPASRHSYGGQIYHPALDMHFMGGGSICSGAGRMDDRWWSITAGATPSAPPTYTLLSGTGTLGQAGWDFSYDPISGNIFNTWAGVVYEFDTTANTYTARTPTLGSNGVWGQTSTMDPARGHMLVLGHWDGSSFRRGFTFNTSTYAHNYVDFTGDLTILSDKGIGLQYVESRGKFYIWSGVSSSELYEIDPVTFNITVAPTTGTAPAGTSNGMFGRFSYSETYGGFIVATNWEEDVHFLKLPD